MTEKYLTVAAYLCSVNSKESDTSIFAGRQQGRRRKANAGQDIDNELNTADAQRSHVFSLDRLASIFAMIASTGGVEKLSGGSRAAVALGNSNAISDGGGFTAEQIATCYGDHNLFTTVCTYF